MDGNLKANATDDKMKASTQLITGFVYQSDGEFFSTAVLRMRVQY